MTIAITVIVLVVIVAVTVVVWLWLRHLDADHRDHRRFLVTMAALGGPENTRAAGEAYTSVGPGPTVRVRSSATEVALGPDRPPRGDHSDPHRPGGRRLRP